MSQPKILVIEDNPDNLKLITWLLEDEDYQVESATSAEEGLQKLTYESFNIILMDVSLPGMDGKEATRYLRKQPAFARLPIIAVTAHAVTGEKENILASGVSALVTKPIDDEELLETIQSFL